MAFNLELHSTPNSDIKLTVALPIYNSKKIAWISLESLIRQENIDFDWELIVYEEIHSESVCPQILEDYKKQLIDKNCKRILYITQNEKPSLIQKWIEISKNVSPTSEAFMLHAADCYSPKERLKISYDKIVSENYDWYDQKKGYFYSFNSGIVVLYNYNGLTNLNMCLKTKYIKTLPYSDLQRGIDGYIYNHMLGKIGGDAKHYKDNVLYTDSIDTHGLNNISKNRETFFKTKSHIFTITNLNINELGLDQQIVNRITSLTKVDEVPTQVVLENIVSVELPLTKLPISGKPKKITPKQAQSNQIDTNHNQIVPNKVIKPTTKTYTNSKMNYSAGKISK
jgi:hypothetical protein